MKYWIIGVLFSVVCKANCVGICCKPNEPISNQFLGLYKRNWTFGSAGEGVFILRFIGGSKSSWGLIIPCCSVTWCRPNTVYTILHAVRTVIFLLSLLWGIVRSTFLVMTNFILSAMIMTNGGVVADELANLKLNHSVSW